MTYNNAYAYPPQPPPQESHHSTFATEASGQQDDGGYDDGPNEDKDGTMQHNNDEDYSLSSCTSNTGTKDFKQQDAGTKDSYHEDVESDPMHYNSNNSGGTIIGSKDRKKKVSDNNTISPTSSSNFIHSTSLLGNIPDPEDPIIVRNQHQIRQ
ncbi:hypothetical protein BGZ58_003216 [Dissophora ornata]|nr:hypothetical protein BGZ58_003216 [Dissophora ornata]